MSTRILNPATMMMTAEVTHKLKNAVTQATSSVPSVQQNINSRFPNPVALARVRRDLFGPVDHAAAKALADRELKAQAMLDGERWNFDFSLGVPISKCSNSRFRWEPVTKRDYVPESYKLRGMPYLRRNSPPSPKKMAGSIASGIGPIRRPIALQATPSKRTESEEITPPPPTTDANVSSRATVTTMATSKNSGRSRISTAGKRQSQITDFLSCRKRPSNSMKSLTDRSEKLGRNSQIRS